MIRGYLKGYVNSNVCSFCENTQLRAKCEEQFRTAVGFGQQVSAGLILMLTTVQFCTLYLQLALELGCH